MDSLSNSKVIEQVFTALYALYNGDSCEVLPTLPDGCVDLSVYSPPFALPGGGALYHYSSSPRDLSNARSFEEFLAHYGFIVRELHRLTKPGRMTAVHCADVPTGNTGRDGIFDLPGEIIRLHEREGWVYTARYCIWKEPLAVRTRTMAKNLAHKTICDDATFAGNAGADYVLMFRRAGENAVPVAHEHGLTTYAGERVMPADLLRFKGWTGKQTENRFSHWIWRQYASSFWDDIRIDNVLPFREAREGDDEKHVHPLQMDVIERIVQIYSLPGETVATPFMGVGSEVFGAVKLGRRGIGVELKSSYWRQAVKNVATATSDTSNRQSALAFEAVATSEALDEHEATEPDAPPAKLDAISPITVEALAWGPLLGDAAPVETEAPAPAPATKPKRAKHAPADRGDSAASHADATRKAAPRPRARKATATVPTEGHEGT